MRIIAAAFALALAAGNTPAAGDEHALQRLLDLHAEAMGGRAAIEDVACMEARLEAEESGQRLPIRYRACRPDFVRVDVTLPDGAVYSEGHDARGGWLRSPGGTVQPTNPEGAAALRHGAELPGNLYGLHELPDRGHRLALAGQEVRGGTRLQRVEVTLADGFRRLYLLDPGTGLIVAARDRRSHHPDMGTPVRNIETRYGDYRETGGVLRPFETCDVDADTGETLSCTRLLGVDVDPSFGPEALARPQ